MNWLTARFLKLWTNCKGQDLLEYSLAVGMMALAAVVVFPPLGATVSNVYDRITSMIAANVH